MTANALINVLLAYLLGSFSGSLMLGALRKVDIRLSGSGNAGGTNAFRTQGFRFALGVVLIDVAKGVLAAAFIPRLHFFGPDMAADHSTQVVLCGFAAIVGHCFPAVARVSRRQRRCHRGRRAVRGPTFGAGPHAANLAVGADFDWLGGAGHHAGGHQPGAGISVARG